MVYENGEPCWQGGSRSTTVSYTQNLHKTHTHGQSHTHSSGSIWEHKEADMNILIDEQMIRTRWHTVKYTDTDIGIYNCQCEHVSFCLEGF